MLSAEQFPEFLKIHKKTPAVESYGFITDEECHHQKYFAVNQEIFFWTGLL